MGSCRIGSEASYFKTEHSHRLGYLLDRTSTVSMLGYYSQQQILASSRIEQHTAAKYRFCACLTDGKPRHLQHVTTYPSQFLVNRQKWMLVPYFSQTNVEALLVFVVVFVVVVTDDYCNKKQESPLPRRAQRVRRA